MRSVWDDTVDDADLEVLDPGVPEDWNRTPDVLVVGGGIVGLATAAMCRRAGLGEVVLCERDRLAGGVSGSAAGGLAPDVNVGRDPDPLVRLERDGLALHRELADEWGTGLEPIDYLLVARDLGTQAIGARGQARVHPLELAAAAARHAGTVLTGVEVTGHERDDTRVVRVETGEGTIEPGVVVYATGTAPDLFATGSAPEQVAEVPQSLVKGHLVATEPAGFRLPTAIASPRALVLQLPCGRFVAGGTLDVGDHEDIVRDEVTREVTEELHRLVPGSRGLEVTHRWCCFRPSTSDRMPVIDRVPGTENAWVTCGHFRTGLTCAPSTGRGIASWIETGGRPDGLEAFAIDRFS